MLKNNKLTIERVELYTVDLENKIDLRRRGFYLLGCNKGRRDSLLVYFSLDDLEKGLFIRKASLYTYVYSTSYRMRQTPILVPYEIENEWRQEDALWIRHKEEAVGEEKAIYHKGLYTIDFTHIARQWYKGEKENKGILLQFKEDAVNTFIKVRGYMSGQQYNSKVIIECGEPAEANELLPSIKNNKSFEQQEVFEIKGELMTQAFYILDNKKTSFFVKNRGHVPVKVTLQISPIKDHFLDEDKSNIVEPGGMSVLTPKYHAKFARIHFQTDNKAVTKMELWYLAK